MDPVCTEFAKFEYRLRKNKLLYLSIERFKLDETWQTLSIYTNLFKILNIVFFNYLVHIKAITDLQTWGGGFWVSL